MITLHLLENSRGFLIAWLLEEIKAEYAIVHYERNKKTHQAPAELQQIHPLGKSPTIEHGGKVLAETGCILTYLIEVCAGTEQRESFYPADQKYNIQYWLHYSEGSLMPVLFVRLIFEMIVKKTPLPGRPLIWPLQYGVESQFVKPELKKHCDFIEQSLSAGYFAGPQMTLADIPMAFPILALEHQGVLLEYSKISDWLSQIQAREAYLRAVEKVGAVNFSQF